MSTLARYWLLQLPGAALAAFVLALLCWAELLLPWSAAALWIAWLAKDALLYPIVRPAYERGQIGAEKLIGARGVARERLDPRGYVRVRGELWCAETVDPPIPAGSPVRVCSARGLTLIVAAAEDA